MNELLLLQTILSIIIWFNTLVAITLTKQVVDIEPFPSDIRIARQAVYTILFLLTFLLWPLGIVKLNK